MVTLTVDTHQFVVRLKKAGIQEKEAEAIAEVVRDAQANADLATKQDLSVVEARLLILMFLKNQITLTIFTAFIAR